MNVDYNTLVQEVKPYPLKKSYLSCIPCNVYIWDDGNKREIEEIRDTNPEVTITVFDDITARVFIKTHFQKDVIDAFDTLLDEKNRKDLSLYCILYHNGGMSLDSRIFLKNGFKLIALTESEFFNQAPHLPAAPGSIMVSLDMIGVLPKNEIMLSCIREIVRNTKLKVYGYNKYYPTGEGLLGIEYAKQSTEFPKIITKGNRFFIGHYLIAAMRDKPKHFALRSKRVDLSPWITKGLYRDKRLILSPCEYDLLHPLMTLDFSNTIDRTISGKEFTFIASNHSICQHPTRPNHYISFIRYINYFLNKYGYPETQYNTTKVINLTSHCILDAELNRIEDEAFFETGLLNETVNRGIEDIRLFKAGSSVFLSGTSYNPASDNYSIIVGEHSFQDTGVTGATGVTDTAGVLPNRFITVGFDTGRPDKTEKNWSFFDLHGETHIVYSWYPVIIAKIERSKLVKVEEKRDVPYFFTKFSGSTPGFTYKDEIWFMVHSSNKDCSESIRDYYSFLVVFDLDMNLLRYSRPFKFENEVVEFCCGMVIEDTRVILSYSVLDRKTVLAVYDRDEFLSRASILYNEDVEVHIPIILETQVQTVVVPTTSEITKSSFNTRVSATQNHIRAVREFKKRSGSGLI
jgi:predicted GH43/DUF377 family glycosyl hydrolase